MMNKQFFKRWSTLANVVLLIIASVMANVTDLGLDTQTVSIVTIIGTVITIIAQTFSQAAKDVK